MDISPTYRFFIQLASLFFFIGELRPLAGKTIIEGCLLTLIILLNVFLLGYIVVGSLFYTLSVSGLFWFTVLDLMDSFSTFHCLSIPLMKYILL